MKKDGEVGELSPAGRFRAVVLIAGLLTAKAPSPAPATSQQHRAGFEFVRRGTEQAHAVGASAGDGRCRSGCAAYTPGRHQVILRAATAR